MALLTVAMLIKQLPNTAGTGSGTVLWSVLLPVSREMEITAMGLGPEMGREGTCTT
ncbi:uncharacterized protein RMCC_6731 [Mycolicibacterium canariasense]|uniref:Uncharacterized protein n=1 Tax=Mycolicibacterium canariasense TaxID=228230 RepID=A0A100WKH1_MYCCR|nr:uncharacterized protein RMCC_6731 [Mycolicibacterium canariasense]